MSGYKWPTEPTSRGRSTRKAWGGGMGGKRLDGSEEQWDKKMKESKLKGVFTQLLTHLYVRLFLQRD